MAIEVSYSKTKRYSYLNQVAAAAAKELREGAGLQCNISFLKDKCRYIIVWTMICTVLVHILTAPMHQYCLKLLH
jgi:cytochrome b561